ncbi:MAG: bifunctional hydroxymethylpyrimidine kinase/phosphomethylpyrimidine kinase [Neisseriaceae bacterium]|nr:bifunctional hydroxymethylpyrimidine kinase/phosphomethylpyrimidine kinase [Neisseriaceae bacterium]
MNKMTATLPVVLSFGASDSSSATGVIADAMTLVSLGCYPTSVITAVLAADTSGSENFVLIDDDMIEQQARLILEDMPVAVFKVGLIGNIENLSSVAEVIADYPEMGVVVELDLTTVSTDESERDDFFDAYKQMLLTQTSVLVTSQYDVMRLFAQEFENESLEASAALCAQKVIELGCEYVVLTDSSLGKTQTILFNPLGEVRRDTWPRFDGQFRGINATLAAALASMVASGAALPEAVRDAQEYTWETLKNSLRLGMGSLIPDRLFWVRDSNDDDV